MTNNVSSKMKMQVMMPDGSVQKIKVKTKGANPQPVNQSVFGMPAPQPVNMPQSTEHPQAIFVGGPKVAPDSDRIISPKYEAGPLLRDDNVTKIVEDPVEPELITEPKTSHLNGFINWLKATEE